MADERVEVRLAVADDALVIAEVIRSAFQPLKANYTKAAYAAVTPDAEEILGRLAEGPIWVAFADDAMVGTVSVVAEPDWLYIRSMAVSPASQGFGVGRKLLVVVEDYATKKGFDKLYLYTTFFLKSAMRLYEKYGFVSDRETPAEEWFGVPGLGMVKVLEKEAKQNVARS